jgi:hypothetical protein
MTTNAVLDQAGAKPPPLLHVARWQRSLGHLARPDLADVELLGMSSGWTAPRMSDERPPCRGLKSIVVLREQVRLPIGRPSINQVQVGIRYTHYYYG